MAQGIVEIELSAGRVQVRDERGRFTAEVEHGTERAAAEAAQEGVNDAINTYYSQGYGWAISFFAEGHGGTWNIVAEGEWAEAAEFGIPGHRITPHSPETHLYNPEDGFGPIWPAGASVWHTGTEELAMIRSAGDLVASMFEGILVSNLP